MKPVLIFGLVMFLSACSTIRLENVTQVEKDLIFDEIVVVNDEETRESVLPVIVNFLTSKGYKVETVGSVADVEPSDYALEYRAWWSWDLALYMSRVHMKMRHNNSIIGNVTYEGRGGLNVNKWGDAERRLEIMLDTLLGNISVEKANKQIQ